MRKKLASLTESNWPDEKLMYGCKQLDYFLSIENDYWHVRSKSDWLIGSDPNTSYFHHHASQKKRRNTIETIWNSEGDMVYSFWEIEDVVVGYFRSLFATSQASADCEQIFEEVNI